MLWALEKKSSGEESTLQQVRPVKTWMELEAEGGTPFAQVWNYQPGYPAPAWGLNVPAWSVRPGGQAPVPAVLPEAATDARPVVPAAVLGEAVPMAVPAVVPAVAVRAAPAVPAVPAVPVVPGRAGVPRSAVAVVVAASKSWSRRRPPPTRDPTQPSPRGRSSSSAAPAPRSWDPS